MQRYFKKDKGVIPMDKDEVIKKLKKYTDLLRNRISPRKIILYGSYAKGNWQEESDIDVAVVLDKIEEDFLTLEAFLYKMRREVDDRIEPILLEESEDKSGFLESILKYGEIIYSQ